ncbi:hypothetical protein EZS27_026620, partial [termite gut metagenome]
MFNKDEILRRTNNGLDIFKRYIPGEWRVGRNFLNPLYEDKRASCNIYFDRRNGCYRIKDFGNDTYSGDCFDFVGKLKGLDCSHTHNFVEILNIIDRELNLGLSDAPDFTAYAPSPKAVAQPETSPNLAQKKNKPYQLVQQAFSVKESAFWGTYGITAQILKLYNVFSLKEFRSENNEGKPFCFSSSGQEPIFGYIGKRHVKIYRPFSEIRFLYGGNFGDNYCFGLEQLPAKGDTLFITGGEKDVLSLSSHGFYAICFNSETAHIPVTVIRKLSHRFKHIVLLYDTDKTGLDASQKHQKELAEFGVKRLVLPLGGGKQEKDISDYFRLGGTRENFIGLFIEFLDHLYNEIMAVLKPCEIDFNNPPGQAEMIISINEVPLGTQGNLFGITGGEGTGKSNYVGSLIAGAIRTADISI